MTKILWFSRHTMTDAQRSDLERIYGSIEVKVCDQTVASWKEVAEAGANCDVLAVVLPPSILADLVNPRNNAKPVIRAKSNRVLTGLTAPNPATGKEEAQYKFEHLGWEQVIKIEVVTKDL